MSYEIWEDESMDSLTIEYNIGNTNTKNHFVFNTDNDEGNFISVHLNRDQVCEIVKYLEYLLYVDMVERERSDR